MKGQYGAHSRGGRAKILYTKRVLRIVLFVLSVPYVSVTAASAQQSASEPCSPAATEFPNSKQLPPPPKPFGGVIKEQVKDSKPCWPPRIVPPQGAPNVLLIMTDDQGYGVPSTFGGVIPTPTLD